MNNVPVQPRRLKANFAYWAIMPEWSPEEVTALLFGLNPRLAETFVEGLSVNQQAEYNSLLELSQRAIDCARVGWPRPANWLAWAKTNGIHVPRELEAAVAKYDRSLSDPSEKTPKIGPKVTASALEPTKMQAKIMQIAGKRWPDRSYPPRVKDRDKAIIAEWPNEEAAPSPRTISRAFKKMDQTGQ